MAIGLGWLGFGVGFVGCAATFMMAASSAGAAEVSRRSRLLIGLTLLLTLLFWAISMQTRPPFSPGQSLGFGFLIGGVIGAVAIMLTSRLRTITAESPARVKGLAMLSVALLGLLGVSTAYVLFDGNPQDALIGFSIGAAMAAILGYYARESEEPSPAVSIEAWALFAIGLAAAVWLSVEHFNVSALRSWWPLPILMAATVCIAGYIGVEVGATRLGERFRSPGLLSTLVAAILVLGLSAVYSWRIVSTWQLLWVAAAGIGVAGLAAWLLAALQRAEAGPGKLEIAVLLVLLVTAFAVVAFKLWSGLGIAVGLIAAWTAVLGSAGPVRESDSPTLPYSHTPILLLSLATVILLFRVFVQEYRFTVGGGDFRIHYTFVGAMLGAVTPFLFVSSLSRLRDSDGERRLISSVALIGLASALAPIVLFLIWDIKVVTGWIYGSVAAVAFLLMARMASVADDALARCTSVALLVAGAQLTAIQFVAPLSELDLTRAARIWILGAAVALAIVGLVITGILSARRER